MSNLFQGWLMFIYLVVSLPIVTLVGMVGFLTAIIKRFYITISCLFGLRAGTSAALYAAGGKYDSKSADV